MGTVRYRVGADIGGTFTDVALLGSDGSIATAKVSSTPEDYGVAIIDGVMRLMHQRALDASHVEGVIHGTTVATNAILQRKGARTALITTAGFRDVLELARLRYSKLYDVNFVKAKPLVPHRLRFVVDERMGPRGEVRKPLDDENSRAVIERVRAADVEALAICMVRSDIPNAEGYMRPIRVIVPPGSIFSPKLPAAANARGITGFRAIETVFGALAKVVPGRVPAASEGGCSNTSIGGMWQGEPFVFTETVFGGWGGRPDRDGVDGISSLAANQSNQPVEMVENDNPIEIVEYGFVHNSGGPGKYRGGLASVREWKLVADEAVFTIRSDRRTHLPYGVAGGKPGTPSWNILNPGDEQQILPVLPRESTVLRKGDSVRHVVPGPGGYGDPLERDPELVLDDVLDEKLGIDYVRCEYGVVIDPDTLSLDARATAGLRRQLAVDRDGTHGTASHVEHFVRGLGLDPPGSPGD